MLHLKIFKNKNKANSNLVNRKNSKTSVKINEKETKKSQISESTS